MNSNSPHPDHSATRAAETLPPTAPSMHLGSKPARTALNKVLNAIEDLPPDERTRVLGAVVQLHGGLVSW